ncbi:MAG: STN domain-containing protein [Bacteroidota bacterium]
MSGKNTFPVFLLFILILFQGRIVSAQQPSLLDKKISLTFTSTPLAAVLRTISGKTGVKFSYNPELIQPGRIISLGFTNLPLRDVLKQLLNDPTISFHEMGNQIVLYRGDSPQKVPDPNQVLIPGKPKIIPATRKNPDTVYVFQVDTLLISQTDTILRNIIVTQYDTVRIADTVFIDKTAGKETGKIQEPQIDDTLNGNNKYKKNKGFYTGLYFEILPGSTTIKSTSVDAGDYLSAMEQACNGNVTNNSYGLVAGYDFWKMGIRTGIGSTRLGEKFAYSYTLETGGFFETDTIEKYYTLTGIDTSWTYITDSAWIPKDSKKYAYQYTNSYTYIDVPFSVKLQFWQNKSTSIYALGGVNVSFLVSVNALHIDPNDYVVIQTQKEDLNPVLFSWHAGVGSAIKISKHMVMAAEVVYRRQTNGQYKDLPVDKRYDLIGVKIASYFKF